MFAGCTNLTNVYMPNTTIIGDRAFADCIYLEEIKFNATNMDDIEKGSYLNEIYTFRGSGINGSGINVIIGANVTKIPSNLFSNFSNV